MRTVRALLCGAAVVAALPVMAQETDQSNSEILVTALRTTTKLQETPIAITAVGQADLENKQIANAQDIAKAVPGLTLIPVSANPSTFQLALRGGTEQTPGLIVSEPAVGLYVDDVYRGRLQGSNLQMADIERIEVLRGPQGTLYGRNTFSGALKVITRTPGANDKWFNASAGYGSYNEFRGDASVGGALAGNLGGSLAVFYRNQDDGWIFNRAQNRMVGRENNFVGRAKLAYDDGTLKVVASASYAKDVNDGYLPVNVSFVPDAARVNYATRVFTRNARPVVAGDPFVTSSPTPSRGETEVFTAGLDLSYQVGAVTLRSITAYVDTTDYFRWDLAAGLQVAPTVFISTFDRGSASSARQWSQELQATGASLNDKLTWLLGVYYFNEQGTQDFSDAFFGFQLPLFVQRTRTDSYAAFAQANYALSERTSLTLGGRYTRDDKRFDATIAAPTNLTAGLNASFDAFTPKLGLEHKFSPDAMGYLSVSRGFKAGGFNGLSRAPAVLNAVYRPQTVWAYEAGLKAEFLDRKLRTNLAVFVNDIDNLQQTAQRGTDFPQINVGSARVWGVELELTARPVPGLDLFSAVAYNNGRYTRLDPAADAATSGARDIPLVSDWQVRLGGTFEQPLNERLLARIGGNMNYTGPYNAAVTNALVVAGWTRIDAFAALATADKRWELNLSVQNLTDQVTYTSGIVGPPFQPALNVLRPRTWMTTLKFKY
ncbi:TonB-dependent receptor [Novosphingobium piscinae]|uniref:TonB-dependent receptor n=1 Tax=Novosphingobium piscinae TaxID=1507448 RepID=A0A7X1FY76_9SPHN|nr:TonB-dependent receptor [Novosphingobium piscinae]MBC2668492.1 TonB-dependent receptor [Novosphingobium piscinae]